MTFSSLIAITVEKRKMAALGRPALSVSEARGIYQYLEKQTCIDTVMIHHSVNTVLLECFYQSPTSDSMQFF